MKWDEDDLIRYGVDINQVGDLVFTEESQPMRLWDLSHEVKNLPGKIHDASMFFQIFMSHKI